MSTLLALAFVVGFVLTLTIYMTRKLNAIYAQTALIKWAQTKQFERIVELLERGTGHAS